MLIYSCQPNFGLNNYFAISIIKDGSDLMFEEHQMNLLSNWDVPGPEQQLLMLHLKNPSLLSQGF